MKKIAAGAAVLAAAGFTGLSMAPAMAVPYANCSAAAADGVYNIQAGDSRYGAHLDRDLDGVGCENSDYGLTPVDTTPGTVSPEVVDPTTTAVFGTCADALAAGRSNIPLGDPAYATHLDRDLDGIACEMGTDEVESGTHEIVDWVPESWNADQYSQMGQVPAGAADTGVVVEDDSQAGGVALGGGLALVAAAGAAVVARRRTARA